MMMPFTMILTICISVVLKRNRGLSLDIGSRYERAEHKSTVLWYHLHVMLVLLDRDWGGGRSRPPAKNFQSPVWGSFLPSGGYTPNPPTNRTLLSTVQEYNRYSRAVTNILYMHVISCWIEICLYYNCCNIEVISIAPGHFCRFVCVCVCFFLYIFLYVVYISVCCVSSTVWYRLLIWYCLSMTLVFITEHLLLNIFIHHCW